MGAGHARDYLQERAHARDWIHRAHGALLQEVQTCLLPDRRWRVQIASLDYHAEGAFMSCRPHSASLRRGRWSESGRQYLVTTIVEGRQPALVELQPARLLVDALRYLQLSGHASTLAYVVMPDHVHWLMSLDGGRSLSSVVGLLKSRSARHINRSEGRAGPVVWQAGFHDRAMRREDDLRHVARYIIANPLRAGLVESPGAWSHWDAVWLVPGACTL